MSVVGRQTKIDRHTRPRRNFPNFPLVSPATRRPWQLARHHATTQALHRRWRSLGARRPAEVLPVPSRPPMLESKSTSTFATVSGNAAGYVLASGTALGWETVGGADALTTSTDRACRPKKGLTFCRRPRCLIDPVHLSSSRVSLSISNCWLRTNTPWSTCYPCIIAASGGLERVSGARFLGCKRSGAVHAGCHCGENDG